MDGFIPDDQFQADDAESRSAQGLGTIANAAGTYLKNQWDQGGQNIHNALGQADQGNYSGLQDMAVGNAAATIGAQPASNLTGVKALVQEQLSAGKSLPEIKAAVSEYLQGQFNPSLSGPDSAHYQSLWDLIHNPPKSAIIESGPIQGTPTNLEQAIANSKNTGDPHHVQDYLAQKFSVSGMQAPDELDQNKLLGLFDNISGGAHKDVESAIDSTIPKLAEGGNVPAQTDFIPDSQFQPDATHPLAQSPQTEGADFIPDSHFTSDEEKYGSPGQQALAGLEGLSQGVLGPIAPAAELATGLTTPEDMRGRESTNPYTHGAGKLAGFAGSLATGIGEGAIVAKAGEAVAKGLNLSSRIGSAAAKTATEMGLLSGGDEITKQIVQDPDATLQTAVADVGLSALLGAGGGAAFASISPLWKSTFGNKLAKGIEDFKGRVNERLTSGDPVAAVTDELNEHYNQVKGIADDVYGPTGIKAADIAKSMPEMHPGITTQMQGLNQKFADSLQKMSEKTYNYPERLVGKLKEDVMNWEKTAYNPQATPSELFNATQDLKQTVQGYSKFGKFVAPHDEAYDFIKETKNLGSTLRQSLEDRDVWKNAAVRQSEINGAFSKFKPALDAFEKKFTTEVPDIEQGGTKRIVDPGKINTYMNQLGKPNAELKQAMLKDFLTASEKYSETLSKSHYNLGLESPYEHAPLSATHNTFQERTLGMKLADAFLDKGLIQGGSSGLGGAIGGGAGAAAGHATGIPGAGMLGGLAGTILGEKSLSPLIKSVLPAIIKPLLESVPNPSALKAVTEYGNSVIKGESLITKGAKNVFKAGAEVLPISYIPSERHRDQLMKLVAKYQQNPDSLTASTNNSLGGYLPAHAMALGKTLGTTTNYLASEMNKAQKAAPLDSAPVESKPQKAAKINTLNIAEQPLVVYSKIKDGTVTPHDIRALSSMYPELYTKMQSNISNALTEHLDKGEIVPYKTRVGLSIFLAQPMDSTFTPQSIIAAQPAPIEGGSPAVGEPVKTKHSTKPLKDFSQQYQTPGQSRELNRIKKG